MKKKIQIIHPGCNYPIKIDSKNIDKAKELYRNCFPKIITVARLDKRKSHQNILMCIIPKICVTVCKRLHQFSFRIILDTLLYVTHAKNAKKFILPYSLL